MLEVIADEETLLPQSGELLKAAAILVASGFIVLPSTNDKRTAHVGEAWTHRPSAVVHALPICPPVGCGAPIVGLSLR